MPPAAGVRPVGTPAKRGHSGTRSEGPTDRGTRTTPPRRTHPRQVVAGALVGPGLAGRPRGRGPVTGSGGSRWERPGGLLATGERVQHRLEVRRQGVTVAVLQGERQAEDGQHLVLRRPRSTVLVLEVAVEEGPQYPSAPQKRQGRGVLSASTPGREGGRGRGGWGPGHVSTRPESRGPPSSATSVGPSRVSAGRGSDIPLSGSGVRTGGPGGRGVRSAHT